MMINKINVCLDFNKIAPLNRWHNGLFTNNLFGDDVFNLIKWDDFNEEENNFLFLYCVPDETVEFLQGMNSNFYNTIKKKNVKLLFQNEQFNLFMFDGNIFDYVPDIKHNCYDINNILYWKITNLLKKHDIGEEHLFFVHSSKGFLQEIKQMQQRKILWINSTLNLKSKHLQFNNNLEWGRRQKVIVDKKLRYHYACLYANRPARHRHYLIKKLHEKNLLNFGKCSLKPCPDFGDTYQLPMDDLLPKGKPNTHITNTLYQETDVFRDIFLWVAAETYCPNGYPYFTEKTVKPIMYKRPFISYGNPGTLTYLRDCGFKTFDNFWDESYDDEKDDDKKIDMITDIIENLCQKNINELDQLYGQMESILEFNKNLLIKTHWRHDLIKFLS